MSDTKKGNGDRFFLVSYKEEEIPLPSDDRNEKEVKEQWQLF